MPLLRQTRASRGLKARRQAQQLGVEMIQGETLVIQWPLPGIHILGVIPVSYTHLTLPTKA